jgi:flagellar L-ring protein precursor FlgH
LNAFVGLPTRGLGATGNVLPEGIGLSSETSFDGLGSTQQSDTLDATVSAIVTQVMPNGSLTIEGQRQITVNGEKQTLHVKGIVRDQDISARNTVVSTSLANAEITYEGEGMISRQQKPGLISRLLDWIWIF